MYTRAAILAKDQREIEHVALYEEGEAVCVCVVCMCVHVCEVCVYVCVCVHVQCACIHAGLSGGGYVCVCACMTVTWIHMFTLLFLCMHACCMTIFIPFAWFRLGTFPSVEL